MIRLQVILTVLSILKGGLTEECSHSDFTFEDGTVNWLDPNDDASPGVLGCENGFTFHGTTDIVYCVGGTYIQDPNATCISENDVTSRAVAFHGHTFNYTNIPIGREMHKFSILYPNVSYIITSNYTANKIIPTIRVHVGLVGKAWNPVLINIQQSTESIGFNLPLKIVGKGSQDLSVNYTSTVREMCSRVPHNETGHKENVVITVTSQEPEVHVHNENFTDPWIEVKITAVQDAGVPLRLLKTSAAKPNEDQWYYFDWTGVSDHTHFVVVNITSETQQCATVTVRNTSCTLNKENINEFDHGMYLTMTKRAAVIVPRAKYPEIFYVSVLAETDDTPCGMSGNETGRGRHKSFVFNIHEHHESTGFLFLPTLILPISSLIFVFATIYIKYLDNGRTTSFNETAAETMDSIEAPAQIETSKGDSAPPRCNTDDTTRRDTLNSFSDEMFPMSVPGFEIPHTRVDFIPLIIALIVIPVLIDILSTRMEQYYTFGQLDVCTFNIECSFPVGWIPDIGRAVSNLCYMAMGLTLLLLTFAHHRRSAVNFHPDMITGIQHDYDILKAISYCIMLQGVIGFIYHVCPNESVLSLSNIFLLVGLAYTFQKIYQNRHPDVRHIIFHPVYITVFCIGLHGMLSGSMHRESSLVWGAFGTLHGLAIIFLPLQYVLLDSLHISPHPIALYRAFPLFRMKWSRVCGIQRCCGAAAILSNLFILIAIMSSPPADFTVYLITVYVVNLLLYITHYVLIKTLQYQESIRTTQLVVYASMVIAWVMGMYYLLFETSIAPGIAPALSREGAKSCLILEMFDGHDAWHFLSALGMFLSSFLILILDDGQNDIQTSHLAVF